METKAILRLLKIFYQKTLWSRRLGLQQATIGETMAVLNCCWTFKRMTLLLYYIKGKLSSQERTIAGRPARHRNEVVSSVTNPSRRQGVPLFFNGGHCLEAAASQLSLLFYVGSRQVTKYTMLIVIPPQTTLFFFFKTTITYFLG